MAQYVLEIRESDGWLNASFKVTEEIPIPENPYAGCTQVVMTNTVNYNEIFNLYNRYTTSLAFSYDSEAGTVSCVGAEEHTWDIN